MRPTNNVKVSTKKSATRSSVKENNGCSTSTSAKISAKERSFLKSDNAGSSKKSKKFKKGQNNGKSAGTTSRISRKESSPPKIDVASTSKESEKECFVEFDQNNDQSVSSSPDVSGEESSFSEDEKTRRLSKQVLGFRKKRNSHLLASTSKEILDSKTPKRPLKRKIMPDRSKSPRQKQKIVQQKRRSSPILPFPLAGISSTPDPVPSTSYASSSRFGQKRIKTDEKVCAWYKITYDDNGRPVFNKKYLKYFMTIDSPDMNDLKNKRFNTSFLHLTPQPDRDIQIFTPEEDLDPKWLENVPHIESELPDIPGTKYAHVFDNIPINESDDEFEFLNLRKSVKKRRSKVGGSNKNLALPDEALLPFDYTGLFDSDSHSDHSNRNKHTKITNAAKASKNAKLTKNAKGAKITKNTKGAQSTQVTKKIKSTKVTKNIKDTRVSKNVNGTKVTKNTKEAEVTKNTGVAKVTDNVKGNKATKSKVIHARKRPCSSDSESISSSGSGLYGLFTAPIYKPFGYSDDCLPCNSVNHKKLSRKGTIKESRKDEDERLLQKFKDVMGNKQINVKLRKIQIPLFSGGVTDIEVEGKKYRVNSPLRFYFGESLINGINHG